MRQDPTVPVRKPRPGAVRQRQERRHNPGAVARSHRHRPSRVSRSDVFSKPIQQRLALVVVRFPINACAFEFAAIPKVRPKGIENALPIRLSRC